MPIRWKRGTLAVKPTRPKWRSNMLKPRRGKLTDEQWSELEAILENWGEDFRDYIASKCREFGIGQQVGQHVFLDVEMMQDASQRIFQQLIKDAEGEYKAMYESVRPSLHRD